MSKITDAEETLITDIIKTLQASEEIKDFGKVCFCLCEVLAGVLSYAKKDEILQETIELAQRHIETRAKEVAKSLKEKRKKLH